MNYRKLGHTGLEVSEIGMGLEHLLKHEQSVVTETVAAAVRGGVNYFDCLAVTDYSEETGTNEYYVKLGKALAGIRDKVYLSFIAFVTKSAGYVRKDFECYLRELKTDHADVFILACCDKPAEYETVTGKGGLLELAKQLRAEGKVKYIGFSTHNTALAHKVIESGDFDVLMYPINPAFDVIDNEETYNSDILGNIWDKAYAYTAEGRSGSLPRKDVYSSCAANGIGLVAMKPFAGDFVLNVEKDAGFTPVNLISYVLAQDGVSTVVPGCEDPRQILSYYNASLEERDFSAAVAKSRWSVKGHCLYCNHCLPCPAGIDIAQVNRLLDSAENLPGADKRAAAEKYNALPVKASECIQCGACEERCPFGVAVREKMQRNFF